MRWPAEGHPGCHRRSGNPNLQELDFQHSCYQGPAGGGRRGRGQGDPRCALGGRGRGLRQPDFRQGGAGAGPAHGGSVTTGHHPALPLHRSPSTPAGPPPTVRRSLRPLRPDAPDAHHLGRRAGGPVPRRAARRGRRPSWTSSMWCSRPSSELACRPGSERTRPWAPFPCTKSSSATSRPRSTNALPPARPGADTPPIARRCAAACPLWKQGLQGSEHGPAINPAQHFGPQNVSEP